MSDQSTMACVSGKNFCSRLFERMMELTEYLDVDLMIEGQIIQAHCFILAASSVYFHKLLKNCPAGNKKPMCKLILLGIFHFQFYCFQQFYILFTLLIA